MKRSLQILCVGAGVAALVVAAVWAIAGEKKKATSDEKPSATIAETQTCRQGAYLGVAVQRLSPAFASHLPAMFSSGQGVLVTAVAVGSPAEKADIRPHDVLMTYGDQKLFSPEQLVKLVRGDKVGRKVTLSVVREGKPKQVTVTVGECDLGEALSMGWNLPDFWPWSWLMHAKSMHPTTSREKETGWQTFDSMTIKNLGDHRFKAEIGYLDQDGKLVHQQFEGTRQEIHKAIMAQKDLPTAEREQLLRSLDMTRGELNFPGMYGIPGYGFSWNLNEPDRVF